MERTPLLGPAERTSTIHDLTTPPQSVKTATLFTGINVAVLLSGGIYAIFELATRKTDWQGRTLLSGLFFAYAAYSTIKDFAARRSIIHWQAQSSAIASRYALTPQGQVIQNASAIAAMRPSLHTPGGGEGMGPTSPRTPVATGNESPPVPRSSVRWPPPPSPVNASPIDSPYSDASFHSCLNDGDDVNQSRLDFPSSLNAFCSALNGYIKAQQKKAGYKRDANMSLILDDNAKPYEQNLLNRINHLVGVKETLGFKKGLEVAANAFGVDISNAPRTDGAVYPGVLAKTVQEKARALLREKRGLEAQNAGLQRQIAVLQTQLQQAASGGTQTTETHEEHARLHGCIAELEGANHTLRDENEKNTDMIEQVTALLTELYRSAFLQDGTEYPDVPHGNGTWASLYAMIESMADAARANRSMHQSFISNLSRLSSDEDDA